MAFHSIMFSLFSDLITNRIDTCLSPNRTVLPNASQFNVTHFRYYVAHSLSLASNIRDLALDVVFIQSI